MFRFLVSLLCLIFHQSKVENVICQAVNWESDSSVLCKKPFTVTLIVFVFITDIFD